MDVKDYCGSMSAELTAWKAKMYDITRKLDSLGSAEANKILPQVQDMHILVEDLATRIDNLNRECPTEWGPDKAAIDEAHVDMRGKYEETMEFLGKTTAVSIPG